MFRFGPFEVDVGNSELRKHGLKVRVHQQALQVLVALLEKPGQPVTREELRGILWPAGSGTFVDFENSLNTAVGKLRQALHDSADRPRFIATIPRRGYRFIGPLEEVAQPAPASAGQSATAIVTTPEPRIPARPFRRWYLAVPLVILVVALLFQSRTWLWQKNARPIRSLVVLPLENLSADQEQEFFADGMTDALITDLGKIGSFRVISRTSAMQYKRTKKSLQQVARELNVDGVVEGAVLRSGDRVRITAQLIRAEGDQHMWAETYERDFRDVLALQADVARAVASQVRMKLTPGAEALLAHTNAVDPDVFELYLKGRNYWHKRTSDDLQKSLECFREAIKRDPHCALAYAGLADAYSLLGDYSLMPTEQAYPRARSAAKTALEIDETLAEAHTSLAYVEATYDWNWQDAERHYRRAIELNPNYATTHHWYSRYLTATARHREALEQIKWAREVDPLSLFIKGTLGEALYFARDFDGAIAAEREVLASNADFGRAHFYLGKAYLQKRLFAKALAELKQANEYFGGQTITLAGLGHAYAVSGDVAGARRVLAELNGRSKSGLVPPALVAQVYAGLGDKTGAMKLLEKGYSIHDVWMFHLSVEPFFDTLRTDQRFQGLLRRMSSGQP
jgi:TolB-like protein/DNA-binding winged helix-turn-helix (wHTH) protein/Flp pilus assembly protein TadD